MRYAFGIALGFASDSSRFYVGGAVRRAAGSSSKAGGSIRIFDRSLETVLRSERNRHGHGRVSGVRKTGSCTTNHHIHRQDEAAHVSSQVARASSLPPTRPMKTGLQPRISSRRLHALCREPR